MEELRNTEEIETDVENFDEMVRIFSKVMKKEDTIGKYS